MRLLLDTHALLWWLAGDERLGERARRVIAAPENDVYVSAASAWEIAMKAGLGKVSAPHDLAEQLDASAFVALPVDVVHALEVQHQPEHHRDPFDRLLVAQARLEGLTLVTADPRISRYDVPVLST